jgi:hypothetical protein
MNTPPLKNTDELWKQILELGTIDPTIANHLSYGQLSQATQLELCMQMVISLSTIKQNYMDLLTENLSVTELRCSHRQLEIIGQAPDGKLNVFCSGCKTSWLAPISAKGLGVQLTETGLSRGCDWCKPYIYAKIG